MAGVVSTFRSKTGSLGLGPAALLAAIGIEARQKAALLGAALHLQETWQDVLNQAGTGAPYIRYTPRREGVASRPGAPPAPDTGALRRSIAVVPQGDDTIRVGTGLDYGRFLEFGTAKMAPRPHARPAKDLAWDGMKDAAKAKLGSKGRRRG